MHPLSEGRVAKLYQRLLNWARSFSSGSPVPISRTIHTEMTVERQGVTVLMDGVPIADLGVCPVCGQKLNIRGSGQARVCLYEHSDPKEKEPDGDASGKEH
jgi:hypothetical protein